MQVTTSSSASHTVEPRPGSETDAATEAARGSRSERERHLSELEALACDTVATRPIRDAVDEWIEIDPDERSLRRLAKNLDVDAGYLARLIGRSRMQDCRIDGQRVRGGFRSEMPLRQAERIVRAIGLAPVELRVYGL